MTLVVVQWSKFSLRKALRNLRLPFFMSCLATACLARVCLCMCMRAWLPLTLHVCVCVYVCLATTYLARVCVCLATTHRLWLSDEAVCCAYTPRRYRTIVCVSTRCIPVYLGCVCAQRRVASCLTVTWFFGRVQASKHIGRMRLR